MSTADAPAREAAWLNTVDDGLPALPATGGGPWQIVQAYWPRTPPLRQTGLYVMRRRTQAARISNARKMDSYTFRVVAWWPLTSGTGSWERDQQDFDDALDLLKARINGPPADKTHGGRFLSVAETPEGNAHIEFDYGVPEQSLATSPTLTVAATYPADDPDYTN